MRKKPSLKQRIQYQFDNLMAHGAPAMIATLAVTSVVIILLASIIVVIGGKAFSPSGSVDGNFVEVMWGSLLRTLDPGTMGGDEGWGFRLVMLLLPTLGGIFIISSLIGVLGNLIQEKMDDLRKGRSLVLEHGHVVILGWSPMIFIILSELIDANLNQGKTAIAILANKGKVEMEDEIRAHIPDTKNTRIICRSGSPVDPLDIDIVNPHDAQSIIVIPTAGVDGDAIIIKTVLAITNNPRRRPEPYNIVTQITNEATQDVLKILNKKDRINVVLTEDIIARITAQTARQAGLSVVYSELLNFSGDEIYFKNDPLLIGKTYGEALSAYQDTTVIGIYNQVQQKILLNPDSQFRFTQDQQVICLAADDDPISQYDTYQGVVQEELIRSDQQDASPVAEKMIMLGWNQKCKVIIQELDKYVAKGSQLTIVAEASFEQDISTCCRLQNLNIVFHAGDKTNRHLLENLDIMSFDHVIILAEGHLDIQEADARTLVTLLHLRDIAETDETPFSIVSEMLDQRNRELASITRVDDFIISTHLISLVLAQLSQNSHLMPVFNDIFDEEGAEIYLKPAEHYVEIGKPMNYCTLIEAARRKGETAIGYRKLLECQQEALSYGIHINPNKLSQITFSEGDKVIVLGA